MSLFKKEPVFAKCAACFAAGALVGAAVALLFAPTTGKKLQKQLKNVVEDQVENVDRIFKKVVA